MKNIQNNYKKPTYLLDSDLERTIETTAIVPLLPEEEKIISDWERLLVQAQRINQMAKELEVAMLELKTIASILNSQRRYLHPLGRISQNICQYFSVSVPWVKVKSDKSLILTTRRVDLFKAEKEATLLAQQLRQQSKKPKLSSPRHPKVKIAL